MTLLQIYQWVWEWNTYTRTCTHTHLFNGPLSRTTRVSQYQKGKTNLDFAEAKDSEWHWHQLGYMQVCISLQTDNHASTPPLSFFAYWMPFLPPNQQHQSTKGKSTEGKGTLRVWEWKDSENQLTSGEVTGKFSVFFDSWYSIHDDMFILISKIFYKYSWPFAFESWTTLKYLTHRQSQTL